MAQPFGYYDLLAMNFPEATKTQEGVPSLLAKTPEMIAEEKKQQIMAEPPKKLGATSPTNVMGQPPISQPREGAPDYEAQIAELYRKGLDQGQSDVNSVREQMGKLGERPSGFNTMDLSPLAAFVDSTTGSNLSQGYRGPTAAKEYDQKKALLQQALQQGQDKMTDNQMNYLKMKVDERKNDEAARLRELMLSQKSQRGDDTEEYRLRNEYMRNPLYKQMGEINKAYQGIESNKADTGPAQQALVYQFSRILDPGSVVRETEYAMSAANMGKINQAEMLFQKMKDGTALSPEQIAFMKDVARNLVTSARSSLNAHNDTYRKLAKRKGVDERNIIVDSFYGSDGGQGGGSVKVKYNGQVMEIPEADLSDALKDGAVKL